MIKKFLILASLVSLAACSSMSPKQKLGAKSGLAGAGVGAVTGAVVGAAIANGDVTASALLGAGIGLPLGIAAGVAYADHLEKKEIEAGNSIIEANRDQILSNQEHIEALRAKTDMESRTINMDFKDSEYLYLGPSLAKRHRK